MFKIVEEKEIFPNNDLKCVSNNSEWAGGSSKSIKNTKTGHEIATSANVNTMKSFLDKTLFGLADGRLGILNKENKEEYIKLHDGNICALNCCGESVLTGSWDKTAILLTPVKNEKADLNLGEIKYAKKVFKHPDSVWKVVFIEENSFITGCADGVIRKFKNKQLLKEFHMYSNAVRGLCYSDNHIYSVDNYGKLLKFTEDGKILKSRNLNEMCFNLCEYKELILICGENGAVFASNKDLQILFKIKLSCLTCWYIDAFDDIVHVAGNNGKLYLLAIDNEMVDQQEEIQDEVKVDKQKISKQSRTFISEGIKYKVENDMVYKEVEGGWELVGASEENWDHSFDVELDNKKYVLSFNDDENVHDVASRFINKNKISQAHHQEIVDYINNNFKRSKLFKKYDTINIDGISKVIHDHPIVQILKSISNNEKFSLQKCNVKNIYQIEEVLFDFEKIPLFIILDICKFLYSKKICVDLSFLFNYDFEDKKEAKTFVFLMTNLVENPPFNLMKLDIKIKRLKDRGFLTLDDVGKYYSNIEIINKSKHTFS